MTPKPLTALIWCLHHSGLSTSPSTYRMMFLCTMIVLSSYLTKKHLHAPHQGTSTMEQRARSITYWPGMSKDIKKTRESCADCNRNAPSQAASTPISSPPPTTPFKSVFADFFDNGGHHYLAVGDRCGGLWIQGKHCLCQSNRTYTAPPLFLRHVQCTS